MSATTSTSASAAPAPTSVLFARGVIARLALWPALRIAVEQGWGGPESAEKRTWLASVIVDAFEEQDPVPDIGYVELTLLQVMEDEFDTVLEDGSAEIVAKDVVKLWDDVQSGNQEAVKVFEEQAERSKGKKVEVEEVAGDNSDWEDESDEESGDDEDEAPALLNSQAKQARPVPEVDEDGFTVVKGKSKSHR
ncbi:hypothetical protein PHLCEN_2v11248 [Hermanssonia centrifuga]|uniref:Pre-rRNA-processing protein TSR2 n=1 Tax=Hermanssonia centrifuga TaxID=98765 RepID=A0A2R6NKP8_9APHY|nr:hypothetical protein PHLCEN_2v11248 [Hermanssonia centrifuga]